MYSRFNPWIAHISSSLPGGATRNGHLQNDGEKIIGEIGLEALWIVL